MEQKYYDFSKVDVKFGFYAKYGKRLLDILISGFGLLVAWPILLIVALLVRFNMGSPVIFKQARPGKNEKVFNIYKFRTMTNATDEYGELLPEEQRLNEFGLLLRKTSLDELPELWNIFVGDISLIGPRPLLVKYLPYYQGEEHLRHAVRPGMTGWAQVNGRNYIKWDERFAKDVEYVKNLTFAMDVKIFFMTIKHVLCRQDIADNPNAVEVKLEVEREDKKQQPIF